MQFPEILKHIQGKKIKNIESPRNYGDVLITFEDDTRLSLSGGADGRGNDSMGITVEDENKNHLASEEV
jgi:hypothetical protein